jgi:hypothetical protein
MKEMRLNPHPTRTDVLDAALCARIISNTWGTNGKTGKTWFESNDVSRRGWMAERLKRWWRMDQAMEYTERPAMRRDFCDYAIDQALLKRAEVQKGEQRPPPAQGVTEREIAADVARGRIGRANQTATDAAVLISPTVEMHGVLEAKYFQMYDGKHQRQQVRDSLEEEEQRNGVFVPWECEPRDAETV